VVAKPFPAGFSGRVASGVGRSRGPSLGSGSLRVALTAEPLDGPVRWGKHHRLGKPDRASWEPLALPREGSLVSPHWWWAGSEMLTTRRRTVVRLTATLIFAGRDRMSVIRRKVPLTSCASARPRHSAAGDRSCNGGSPACREQLGHPHQPMRSGDRRSRGVTRFRRRSSPPTRTRRAHGRWRRPRPSWCSCGSPGDGTGR